MCRTIKLNDKRKMFITLDKRVNVILVYVKKEKLLFISNSPVLRIHTHSFEMFKFLSQLDIWHKYFKRSLNYAYTNTNNKSYMLFVILFSFHHRIVCILQYLIWCFIYIVVHPLKLVILHQQYFSNFDWKLFVHMAN